TTAPMTLNAPARARSLKTPALIVAGIVVASLVATYIATNVYASLAQRTLDGRMADALERWAPLDPAERSSIAFASGDPVARLVAEDIGLDVVIAEGATPSVMRRAPGHLPGSATPGEQGVAIVTANRLGFGSFFARLSSLDAGDRIVTESVFGRTTYTVMEVRTVAAERLDLATDSNDRVLMLFGSARLWGGPDRIVVRAVAAEAPQL
ncbi:MAG TPA: sortase, partial [Actinomycetota bacterium]|nr:sortase [Actinomycetota bacterium]